MDGIILIDKPPGITSSEVVRRIKALVKPARVGHLGTLDPFATGLLPILIGEATKIAPFLEGGEKEYEGLIGLGAETDTLDRTGEVVRTAKVPVLSRERLEEIARRFTGSIEQVPPVFSAIKRGGVRLYRLARRGEEVEPPAPRRVEISRLTLELADPSSIRFSVRCSTGTYVRSLARDIGIALGAAAHLKELRRTRSGAFSVADAHPLDLVLSAVRDREAVPLIAMREALGEVPEAEADSTAERRIRNGDSRALDAIAPRDAPLFKVVAHGSLLAIARNDANAGPSLIRVFSTSAG